MKLFGEEVTDGERGSNLKNSSIKRRLTCSFILVIVITVAILELILINILKQNYYRNLEENMENQLRISTDLYYRYFSEATLSDNVLNNVDTFWKQTSAEVQIIDLKGNLLMDSIGIQDNSIGKKQDVIKAMKGGHGRWIGKVSYADNELMAVSEPLKSNDKIVGVLRFVTSLKSVNSDLISMTYMFISIGIGVIFISGIFSVFLANSITGPLKNVTEAAEKMAEGNYDVQCITNTGDEIGKLSDTLNYMAKEVIKKDQLKNDFISSVSHELRTPLTSIKGWAITLKGCGPDDREVMDDGLNIIEKESDRLTGMVEELLDFSKFVSGKITLKNAPVDVERLMDYIKTQLTPRAERDNIHFKVYCRCHDIPLFFSDENRLKQVFVNLLDNAFKFTREGGTVTFSVEKKLDKLFFIVTDNGCGISHQELPRVKEKFYKGKSSKSQNGIGLSICDEIVKLMKGEFKINSELNVGTEAIVILPFQESENNDSEI